MGVKRRPNPIMVLLHYGNGQDQLATVRQRLTKRIVDSIEPGPKTIQVRDAEVPGFGVLITPAGHRSYFLHYSIGRSGQEHRATRKFLTIGTHGTDLTVDEARGKARRWRQLARDGVDPATTLRISPEPQALTFQMVGQRYLDEYSKVHH